MTKWWVAFLAVAAIACGSDGSGNGGAADATETTANDAAGTDLPVGVETYQDPDTGCTMSTPYSCKTPWPAAGQCGVAAEGCKLNPGVDLTGRLYRIDHLYVDSPKGPTDDDPNGAIAATLSCLWNTQIAKDELVILFHITKHDPATGELEFEAGSGTRNFDGANKCKYQFLANPAPQTVKLKIDGCTFKWVNKTDGTPDYGVLRIYPDLITSPIPVVNMLPHGALTPDGGLISNGCLGGGICVDAAKKIDFKLAKEMTGCTNFYEFMSQFPDYVQVNAHDLPCDDGTRDGFEFKGRFDATWIATDFLDQRKSITRDFSCNN
ncbi:MAG: hypothetical protein FJ087_03340 [Deltaproteobacteria bacterium]|nr:hypothetical protein [Deltaproteobacteria bacterium]